MNWEAIGAVGEILGALAVIITLIYLARQVAATKIAVRRQISNDVNAMFNSLNQVVASTPELADAIATLEAGGEPSKSQVVQVRAMFISQMNGFENMYGQMKNSDQGLAEEEMQAMVNAYLDQPWTSAYWNEYEVYFSEEFKTFVNGFRSNG